MTKEERDLIDNMSGSDVSDEELDDCHEAVELYRKSSSANNILHIPSELTPSKTACSEGRKTTRNILIDTLSAVKIKDGEMATMKPTRFCRYCLRSRPTKFHDTIVKHFVTP